MPKRLLTLVLAALLFAPLSEALADANRTGFEPGPDGNGGIDFWGNSFVCGPQGEYLARADRDQEQTLVVDLDMARSEEVRRIWPYLRDRRVDAYQDLTKRYRD